MERFQVESQYSICGPRNERTWWCEKSKSLTIFKDLNRENKKNAVQFLDLKQQMMIIKGL